MTIGERIKKLRQKRDLTQEKLADYLGVSYQAVSKWETNLNCPDLALIAPLTKLLGVSADELLGLSGADEDKRHAELEEKYESRFQIPYEEQKKIAEIAVNEYPTEIKYRIWLADCIYCLAVESPDDEEHRIGNEKATELYRMIIEDAEDGKQKNMAIWGIVRSLTNLGRRDEAGKYAELYPDHPEIDKKEIMAWWQTGVAKEKCRQEILKYRFVSFLGVLGGTIDSLERQMAVAEIIKIMFPDGNYLDFNDQLYFCYLMQAKIYTKEKRYEEAMDALYLSLKYARDFDALCVDNPGTYRYSSASFNLLELNTEDLFYAGIERTEDSFFSWIEGMYFEPLRERDDFKSLLKSKK